MDYLVIGTVAFIASGLTLFSGFGLGTVLLPAFAVFFPLPVAVAATAVVHLANNLFKFALLGKHADPETIFHFGLPAMVSSLAGAAALLFISRMPPLFTYEAVGRSLDVTMVKLTVGSILILVSATELRPGSASISFDKRHMFLGGVLSGFFGGFAGMQGALRSAFLIRAGLSKEAFIATGVVAAVMVDIGRLGFYGAFGLIAPDQALPQMAVGCLAAFLGAFLGAKLLKKVTLRFVRILVGVMLSMAGALMMVGLI